MKRLSVPLLIATSLAAQAAPAHQDWVIRHQPDRFVDRVMMEAWADGYLVEMMPMSPIINTF